MEKKMSGLYENNKTIRELNEIISKNHPGEDVQFYFVFGYPRSDIGKGTLIAQLLNCVPKSDAIKFDGLLNTNENGRHTASGHDDFGIYEQFNPGRKWSREHYLLGGELFRDFINKNGENENLQMSIHFSKYVESVIYKMWNNIGKPQTLFIEVGGLISDPEVGPIFTPIVQRMQKKNLCKVILITELQYGDYIKTKEIQEAYRLFLSKNINPWLIMMREPIELQCASTDERLEFERVVSTKIRSNLNEDFLNIISIPYFHNINEYTEYIKERVFNMFNNKDNKDNKDDDKKTIFIATGNNSKIQDFKLYLGDEFNLESPKSFNIKINIPEGINSIEDNAIAKARAYAYKTGLVSIGDDTGFFIEELNGEPGVALRRWGGELPEETTNAEFWSYLQEKTKNLNNYKCYFKQCVAIVSPTGEMKLVYNINHGILNKEKLKLPYNGTDYPLAAAFESENREKTWDEMTDKEKKDFDKVFINNLLKAIDQVIEK